jgi:mRNA-degrading endonuclease RelE of RelBE toxin-antitoxin system
LAHKVQFTADGLKDAKHLPKGVRNSLAKALKNKLAVNPLRCSEELREPLAGWRSFHYGKYRVIFKLYEEMKLIAIARDWGTFIATDPGHLPETGVAG